MEHKKKYLFIGILLIIVIFSSGTYAIWQWSTTVAERTKVVFEVSEESKGFSCSADGGGNITSNDVVLAPARCTSDKYAIRREVKVMPSLELEGIRIKLNLNLDIKKIGTGLSGSDNFKYALTTNPNSCVDDLVETGNFKGKKAGDSVELIIDKEYSQSMEELYYLYVWLDEAETSTSTMNQPFDLALSGTCAGMFEDLKVTFDVNGGEYVPIENVEPTNFSTYGEYEYTVPYDGLYKLEAWGAQGGSYGTVGGYGGYTSGLIELTKDEKLYVYVGQSGVDNNATFNGGGQAGGNYNARAGGGATDVRLVKGTSYDETSSLASRIMVAGGGGGSEYYSSVGSNGGAAGGLIAYSGGYYRSLQTHSYTVSTGGTQISGGIGGYGDVGGYGGSGIFGIGGSSSNAHGGGGGGGYYGGGCGSFNSGVVGSGAGGSSFISGHIGSVAIASETSITPRVGTNSGVCSTGTSDNLCSIHYSGKSFVDTLMIDGAGYSWSNVKGSQSQMPNPNGGSYSLGVGHSGDGYVRITPLNYYSTIVDYGKKYGELPVAEKEGYEFFGWSTVKDDFNTLVTEDSIVNAKTPHTLYALFSSIYTINFDLNGGELDRPETVNYTTTGEHQYVIPFDGEYQLEVWGAQGGTSLVNGLSGDVGGYGGYSVGTIFLNEGTNIYVNIGGKGGDGLALKTSSGGYNGGGSGTSDNSDDDAAGGGGGATHIALNSGILSSLSSNRNMILLVAGGGGGTAWTYLPGHGGGIYGGKTVGTSSLYPAQSSGYSFGQGQNASGVGSSDGVGGGGGGYYGGYSNDVGGSSSGTGGSGYIGNDLLFNKSMYCYNCETSIEVGTLTYSTTNVSDTAISNYAKSGDGAARITFLTSAKEVVYYKQYGDLPVPTREFYSFVGWNTKSDGTGEFIKSNTRVMNDSEHTLYAIWENYDFDVSYSVNGGVIASTTTSADGNTTYNWTTNNDIVSLNGNSNFYKPNDLSNFELNNYNDVNYMDISRNGYSVIENSEWICLEGCKVDNSVYSQDTTYKYSDFCDSNSDSCNVVLGVNWKQIYTINYDANGGSGAPESQTKLYGVTLNLSNNVPIRDGYAFLGWSTSSDATSASYSSNSEFTINDNVTLYAVWTNSYIISYNSGNLVYGLNNLSSTTTGGGTYSINNGVITLTANYDDGYVYTTGRVRLVAGNTYSFNCDTTGSWGIALSTVEAFLMLDGQLNTYYHMDSNENYLFTPSVSGEYHLRFDVNKTGLTHTFSNINISQVLEDDIKYHGVDLELSSVIPVKNGYTFLGWSTSSSATSATYVAGGTYTSDSSTTLYAVWQVSSPVNSYSCANKTVGSSPYVLTYTGNCTMIDDGNGDWRVKFLTDGKLTISNDAMIDIFLVGGGGGGGSGVYGAGGGGGYTNTILNYDILKNDSGYSIDIGDGGAASGGSGKASSGFGYSVNGGGGGGAGSSTSRGGAGGSGGGGYKASGGSNGTAGGGSGGAGQGRTTCEFGQGTYGGSCNTSVTLYSSGGAGHVSGTTSGTSGTANTGNGGGGNAQRGAAGGSGIVIIRNSRNIIDYAIDFDYTGSFEYINDGSGNWRIKFLTDGIFKTGENIDVDIFLVGGGGGGYSGESAAGGGGGYTNTILNYKINKDTNYSIDIGDGGAASGGSGKTSSGFGYSVNGGLGGGGAGSNGTGGSGGSGGGSYNYNGGSNGANGSGKGGTGQGRTTCEFGQGTYGGSCNTGVKMYSNGGRGHMSGEVGGSKLANSGDGGDGGALNGSAGGSGIVVIRNAR